LQNPPSKTLNPIPIRIKIEITTLYPSTSQPPYRSAAKPTENISNSYQNLYIAFNNLTKAHTPKRAEQTLHTTRFKTGPPLVSNLPNTPISTRANPNLAKIHHLLTTHPKPLKKYSPKKDVQSGHIYRDTTETMQRDMDSQGSQPQSRRSQVCIEIPLTPNPSIYSKNSISMILPN
jgi:hypothetical protein